MSRPQGNTTENGKHMWSNLAGLVYLKKSQSLLVVEPFHCRPEPSDHDVTIMITFGKRSGYFYYYFFSNCFIHCFIR